MRKDLGELQLACKRFSDAVVRLPGVSALITKNESFAKFFKDMAQGEQPAINAAVTTRLKGCFEVFQHICSTIQVRANEFREMEHNLKKLQGQN